MKHINYTCDGCGKIASNRISNHWLHFDKPVSVIQDFSISEDISDLCSIECFAKAITKKVHLEIDLPIDDWNS